MSEKQERKEQHALTKYGGVIEYYQNIDNYFQGGYK